MKQNSKPDQRYPQANREAWITLGLYGGYFVWWYVSAYALGSGDPEHYTYILGFPAWFFFSCILGYPLLSLILWAVMKYFFKDMPLDAEPEDEQTATALSKEVPGDKHDAH